MAACVANTELICVDECINHKQGLILTVFCYSEHPKFWHGLPRRTALESGRVTKILLKLGSDFYGIPLLRSHQTLYFLA